MKLYLVLDDSGTGAGYEDHRGLYISANGYYVRSFTTEDPIYGDCVCSIGRALGRYQDCSAVKKEKQKLLKVIRIL